MKFPVKPLFFHLNELECRLLAPRIARPHKVAECAKWLVNNGDLYKEEGITFNDSCLEGCSNISLVDDSDEYSEHLGNVESNAANRL